MLVGDSPEEKQGTQRKLDFFPLKWAIRENYLYGNSFTVITDNSPLTYLLATAKLNAKSYHWLATLSLLLSISSLELVRHGALQMMLHPRKRARALTSALHTI